MATRRRDEVIHPACKKRQQHNWDQWHWAPHDVDGKPLRVDPDGGIHGATAFSYKRECQNMGCDAAELATELTAAASRVFDRGGSEILYGKTDLGWHTVEGGDGTRIPLYVDKWDGVVAEGRIFLTNDKSRPWRATGDALRSMTDEERAEMDKRYPEFRRPMKRPKDTGKMTTEEADAEAKRRWGTNARVEVTPFGLPCTVFGGEVRSDGYADVRGSGSDWENAFFDADWHEAGCPPLED